MQLEQLLAAATFIGVVGGAIHSALRARADARTSAGRLGLDGWIELTNQLRGRIEDLHQDIRAVERQRDHAVRWLRWHESRSAELALLLRSHGIALPPAPPEPPAEP